MKTGETKVYGHPSADTLYIAIPAKMANDTSCPFKAGDVLELEIVGKTVVLKRKSR